MKKLILSIFFLIVATSLSTSSARADAMFPSQQEHADQVDLYINQGETTHGNFLQNDLGEYLWSWVSIIDPSTATNDISLKQERFNKGVYGQVLGGIAYIYTSPPANVHDFVAYYGNKMQLVQPAYAQGVGFAGLSPLLGIWRAFRNIAYGFLILIMVSIGFMMMFRVKIDPRTVISIQNAIPRIIMTLIIITFSYAIVGLLIDLMYLVILLVLFTVRTAIPFNNPQIVYSNYTGGSSINLLTTIMNTGSPAIDDLSRLLGGHYLDTITGLVGTMVGIKIGTSVAAGVPLVGGAIGAILGGAALGSGWISGSNPLVALLVYIALLFVFIRILFVLINAYVQILIALIFGPIQLMFGAIPNSTALSSWLRNLVANLGAFVIVMCGMFLAQIMGAIASVSTNLWTPPGLSGAAGNAIGSGVGGIISIGILFTLPNIANALKEALKAKPALPIGPGALFQPIGAVYNTAMSGMSQMYYMQHGPLGGIMRRLTGKP